MDVRDGPDQVLEHLRTKWLDQICAPEREDDVLHGQHASTSRVVPGSRMLVAAALEVHHVQRPVLCLERVHNQAAMARLVIALEAQEGDVLAL